MEKPELRGTKSFDIAVTIENGESLAIFQDTRSVVRQSRRRAHIVFICNADNVRQNKKTVLQRKTFGFGRLRGSGGRTQNRLV